MSSTDFADDSTALDALADAYENGLSLEKAGDIEGAIASFHKALRLDPSDHGGVQMRLAALGVAEAPDRCPPAYVETLFDQHAEAFESILVGQLGYGIPALMADALRVAAPGPYDRMLDLGCGTGLAGEAVREMGDYLAGVDLSEHMLDLADDKGVFNDLYVGDAEGFLRADVEEDPEGRWSLILAADVLPYLGAVDGLFSAAAAKLTPGGVLLVSTETLPADAMNGADHKVHAHRRFAHSLDYITKTLTETGLILESAQDVIVRYEEGAPTPGHLILARKPA